MQARCAQCAHGARCILEYDRSHLIGDKLSAVADSTRWSAARTARSAVVASSSSDVAGRPIDDQRPIIPERHAIRRRQIIRIQWNGVDRERLRAVRHGREWRAWNAPENPEHDVFNHESPGRMLLNISEVYRFWPARCRQLASPHFDHLSSANRMGHHELWWRRHSRRRSGFAPRLTSRNTQNAYVVARQAYEAHGGYAACSTTDPSASCIDAGMSLGDEA